MSEKSDHDLLIEVHTCLLDPQRGLCRDFQELKANHYKLEARVDLLKRNILIGVAFLIGTGLLSVGSLEAWKTLSK